MINQKRKEREKEHPEERISTPDEPSEHNTAEMEAWYTEKPTDVQEPQLSIPEKDPLDLSQVSDTLKRKLWRHGIYTPWDLMKYSMDDCGKLHGMGEIKLAELRSLIDSKGIYQNPAIWSFYEKQDSNHKTNLDRIMSSQRYPASCG